MAYNDRLVPKLSLLIVGVNVSLRNVRGHQLPPRHIPSVWVWPRSGHELPDSSPYVRFTMIDTSIQRGACTQVRRLTPGASA
jgi:hypothetical protein